MLLQEALSRLKIIDKQLVGLQEDISQYSCWNDRKNHPLGKVGTNEFSKKEAEKILKSKLQQYRDLVKRYNELKLAIQKTNLETFIEIDGKKISIAEALVIKRESLGYQDALIRAINYAKDKAEHEVERFNNSLPNDALKENQAKV